MNKLLDRLEEFIIAALMAVATIVIFISVVHRYLSGYEIPLLQDWLLDMNVGWAQEFCIILFVWMAKFGAAYGVRTGIHVGVDILINKLSGSSRAARRRGACPVRRSGCLRGAGRCNLGAGGGRTRGRASGG